MIGRKKKGFSLSIDVIAYLIAVLAIVSIGLWKSGDFRDTAKINRAATETAAIGALVSEYRFETGEYPEELSDLTEKKDQYGPWIKEIPEDPWNPGNEYKYKKDENGFSVYSVGKGGQDSSTADAVSDNNIGHRGK